jgi:type IX secretion system PorP/SprF family membrane protein
MKRIYLFLICFIGVISLSQAQQYPVTTQYLVNPYSINTSYAGLGDGFEAFISYKKQSINYDYTPRTMGLYLNGPVGKSKKVGLGLSIVNDKTDIFNTIYGSASYAYHVKLAENHYLDLSLMAGVANKSIDLTDVVLDPRNHPGIIDPVVQSIGTKGDKTSGFLGAGLVYRWKNLAIGGYAPYLTTFNEDIFYYDLKQSYIIHASYDWKIDDNWNVEPWAIMRGAENSPWNYDFAVIGKYKQKVWLTLLKN